VDGHAGAYAMNVRKRANAWLRRHPLWVGWLVAAVLLVFSAAQFAAGGEGVGSRAGYFIVTLVLAATGYRGRRYPVAAFAVAAVIGAMQIAFGIQSGGPGPVWALQPSNADLAILVLLYNLAAHRPRRESIVGLVICLAGGVIAVTRWGPAQQPYATTSVLLAATGIAGLTLTAWVLGDSVAYRYRLTQYAALEERAARLEVERDAQARIAAAAERERELTVRRARVVDEAEARLRTIERNLHDGAQVRLAALAMTLGEIKENLERAADPEGTISLATAAHVSAKEALTELRDLARGIHPAVLDRGLPAALGVLAEASAVPATAAVDIAQRPSPAIEAIAYYCAAELLANVAKHAGARRVTIDVQENDGRLRMSVTDDGAGGARLKPGGGLTGLADRVQTVDGRLSLQSPPGGPTTVTIELPVRA